MSDDHALVAGAAGLATENDGDDLAAVTLDRGDEVVSRRRDV